VPVAAGIADRRNKTIKRMEAATRNKHISNLSGYFQWLQTNKKIPKIENPFAGLWSKRKKGRAARDERRDMWPFGMSTNSVRLMSKRKIVPRVSIAELIATLGRWPQSMISRTLRTIKSGSDRRPRPAR
jgi:hypothetical protein